MHVMGETYIRVFFCLSSSSGCDSLLDKNLSISCQSQLKPRRVEVEAAWIRVYRKPFYVGFIFSV